MKEIFCFAVFVGKLLGFLVFVNVLRPHSIGVVEAPTRSAYCKIERSRAQGCELGGSAALSSVDVGTCSGPPTAAHC